MCAVKQKERSERCYFWASHWGCSKVPRMSSSRDDAAKTSVCHIGIGVRLLCCGRERRKREPGVHSARRPCPSPAIFRFPTRSFFSTFTAFRWLIDILETGEVTRCLMSIATRWARTSLPLNIPGSKKFLHKNSLCGSEDTQWMAAFVEGRSLHIHSSRVKKCRSLPRSVRKFNGFMRNIYLRPLT